MQIFVTDGNEEYGPYGKDEVFALLKDGQLEGTILARTEEETEWLPVMDVLKKSAASKLFSLEEIAIQEQSFEPPKIFIEPSFRKSRPAFEDERSTGGIRKAVLFACTGMLVAFAISFLWFRRSGNSDQPRIPSAVIVAAAKPQTGPTPLVAANNTLNATQSAATNQLPATTGGDTAAPMALGPKVAVVSTPSPTASNPMAREPEQPTIHQTELFKSAKISPEELVDILKERFSSPPLKIFDTHDERTDKTLSTYEGSFYLETKLQWNPKVEVVYKIPLRPDHLPGPHASNIVMLGFYPGAAQPPEMKIVDGKEVREPSKITGALSYYADKLGYTAFSMQIVTKKGQWHDPKESYVQGGPEWVDIVFRAQEEIEKRYKLKPKKLLLCGMSLGGTFVERIAAARPDRVAAVALHSAPEITLPKASTDTAWFLGISRGDSMTQSYNHLFNGLADLKDNTVFGIFPPNYKLRGEKGNFYHSESAIASTAARSFLKGVVDSTSPSGKIDVARWPFVRDRTAPLRIYRTGATAVAQIPNENREYLPSKAFVQCLESIPAPMQTISFGKLNGHDLKCLVGLPPLGKPKGVLIYSEKIFYANISTMMDNIYYLANQGYLVLAPNLASLDSAAIKTTVGFVKRTPTVNQLPLVYVGSGEKGNCVWDFVARDPDASAKAVAMIGFETVAALDESKWPVGLGIKCPILFVYDEKPVVDVATAEQAHESLEKVRAVGDFVKRCKERHQPARVVYIPQDTGSDVRVAQKSMESVNGILSKLLEGHNSVMEEQ
jgi:hypothetical protein